ncbi:electron transfer flavoprotein subunit beta/FixA family protein [Streptomyces sp. BH106]|uniref:electron transfer flavoprotein subunit beta/FixA family protein n=1 Tax=Streptomyces sp. BH106 TaxID=3410409 RepID=UPI003CEC5BE1
MSNSLSIVVCVRPPDGDDPDPALGELDLRAVEYGVQLSREHGQSSNVTAVAVGGGACLELLRECSARGVDRVIHVEEQAHQDDGLDISRRLAGVVGELAPDLVLCGNRSDTGMHGTVPRELAHLLDLPFVGSVTELSIEGEQGAQTARAVQRLERGDRWAWGCALPLVCGVERDICAPRYLAVRRRRRAGSVIPVTPTGAPHAADGGGSQGALMVEGREPPRIRPKKSKVTTAKMSAADRMKLLRGGGKAPAAGAENDDDKPRRVVGDPEAAAAEIIKLLEKKDLLKS